MNKSIDEQTDQTWYAAWCQPACSCRGAPRCRHPV